MKAPQLLWAVALTLGLSACGSVGEILGISSSCSSFNGERDGLSLSISDNDPLMSAGGTYTLSLTTTWLNNDLRRVPINCSVEWITEPAGIVTVEGRGTVTTQQVGAARVTARVGGSGGVKTASVMVGVIPVPTEVEPNNGRINADPIADGQTHYGVRDYAGDEDWFEFTLAPGQGAQVTLQPAIDASASWSWSYSYSGSVRDANDSYVAPVNQTFVHTGAAPALYYVRVAGSGSVPYAVSLDLFTP